MEDYLQVCYVGLTEPEIKVLKSMFMLVPQLNESYKIIAPEKIRDANIILVNSEDPLSMNIWKEISHINTSVTPLMLKTGGASIQGTITLHRPLRMQKLITALEDIVRDRTFVSAPTNENIRESEFSILVVDDSYPVRKYMESKLVEITDLPLRLSFAASGDEAMEKFKLKTYDLVFLDVVMPGVDGYKVCKTMKNSQLIYIVMLTSKKSPFDKIRGTMSGCNAFITKPPSDARLLEEINACLKSKQSKHSATERLKLQST